MIVTKKNRRNRNKRRLLNAAIESSQSLRAARAEVCNEKDSLKKIAVVLDSIAAEISIHHLTILTMYFIDD